MLTCHAKNVFSKTHINHNLPRAAAVDSAVQSVAFRALLPAALSPGATLCPGAGVSCPWQCTLPASTLPLGSGDGGRSRVWRVRGQHARRCSRCLAGGRRAALAASRPGLGWRGPQQAPSTWIRAGRRKQPGEVLQMKRLMAKKQI